jgi:uncharacterized membrane protein YbaN (DUF454 family)
MIRRTRIFLWRSLAVLAFVTGVIGAFLPIVPTVPFLIVAAWAASKAWPEFESWLLRQRTYGPIIRRWRERGEVPRRAKVCASGMMLVSATGLQFAPAPLWVRLAIPAIMFAVAVWLWLRPEPC